MSGIFPVALTFTHPLARLPEAELKLFGVAAGMPEGQLRGQFSAPAAKNSSRIFRCALSKLGWAGLSSLCLSSCSSRHIRSRRPSEIYYLVHNIGYSRCIKKGAYQASIALDSCKISFQPGAKRLILPKRLL